MEEIGLKFIIKCLPVFILGVILFVPSALADNTVKRIGGSTRYDTAVLAAKQSWGEAKTVIITKRNFICRCNCRCAACISKNAPLLFTNKDQLSA